MTRAAKRAVTTLLALAATALVVPGHPADAADTLLSRGKSATASASLPRYGAALAVDGLTSTRWAGPPGVERVSFTIDLGARARLSRVQLDWATAGHARVYRIDVSDDGRVWRTLYRTSRGDGRIDDVGVTGTGRYVRLYATRSATGWGGYSLREFGVHGTFVGGTVTATPTGRPTGGSSATPSATATASPRPGRTTTPGPTPTASAVPSGTRPTASPTGSPTDSPTASPTASPTGRPSATNTPGTGTPTPGTRDGWTLVWSDEFNDAKGTRPDSRNWNFDTGGEPKWGNNEWQYYTDRKENVSTDGAGNLAITARRERLPGMENCLNGTCDITSGRITTRRKFDQTYGRFEARIKVPDGRGLWPAFWMMGENGRSWPHNGEIDIMEIVGSEPSTVYGTLHGSWSTGTNGLGGHTSLPAGQKFADDFHVFAVEWSPQAIVWMLDGKKYFEVQKSKMPAGKNWIYDHPFYMLLNLAVGGDWPGPPNASTKFPATMLVDYVRVYKKTGE